MLISWRDCVLSFNGLPKVGPLMLAGDPAWVWSRDGGRVLWANPAGCRLLGADSFETLWSRRWPDRHPLRRAVDGLVRTLPERGALARLRLREGASSLSVTCRCERVRAGDARAVLVVALEGATMPASRDQLTDVFGDERIVSALLGERAVAGDAAGSPDEPAADLLPPTQESGPAAPLDDAGLPIEHAPVRNGDGEAASARDWESEPDPPASTVAAAPRVPDPVDAPVPVYSQSSRAEGENAAGSRSEPATAEPPREAVVLPIPREVETLSTPAREAEPDLTPVRAAELPSPDAMWDEKAPPSRDTAEFEEPGEAHPGRSVLAGRVPRELSRKPVRFLWQTDSADRFLFVSPGLAQVVGRSAEIVGERWQDAAARLRLDPAQRITRALAQRDTWSGQTAWWPIEGSEVRVPAELTALPVFAADRSFQGYRGFGVLRPAEALMPAAFDARFGASGQSALKPAEQIPPYEESAESVAANVVPIRSDIDLRSDHVRLTAQERSAFEEIAAELRNRVEATSPAPHPKTLVAAPNQENTPEPIPAEPPPAKADSPTTPAEPARPEPDVASSAESLDRAAAVPEAPEEAPSAQPEPPSTDGPPPPPRADPPPERVVQPGIPVAENVATRPATRRQSRDSDAQQRLREMTAILDTATDGVLTLDAEGVIQSANASAEALFGLEASELAGLPLGELLTPAGRDIAFDYLSGLRDNGVASLLNEGREVDARVGPGSITLFMTIGRISQEGGGRFCAVLRDITHWKRTEAELVAARQAAEAASKQKSDFLARVSHEIRTPLNAMIGFAELMIEERFGPVGNERYREYLRDIRSSGEHVVNLVNDLLDISKIEAGKLDLHFAPVPLNELVRESIASMQPQASRAQVVLRSSLSRDVPAIVADQRTLRQIVLNLLSNSVKFTPPGGQVIASTSLAESGEALLRIRDTGEGMTDKELARALEPFRQIATAPLADRTGTGLGLPLTKALVEANRATLAIRSARGEGTVVTVTFPPTRVLSE